MPKKSKALWAKNLEEYVVRRTGDPNEAEIIHSGKLAAYLDKIPGELRTILKYENGSGRTLYLDPKVNGTIAPFSTAIYDNSGKPILEIKSGCFSYRGKIYMFKSLPQGKSMKGHLHQLKFITRLDHLPYHNVDEIDRMTREKLQKHRGVEVGTLEGLGTLGHEVTLDEELEPIGLPLSAASYLLYSTG
jgi:hypothetical protein